MKFPLLLLALSAALFAYTDNDMDGVDDATDRCPHTPLNELVNEEGCTVQSLGSKAHYDVVFGLGYSQLNYVSNTKDDTLTTSVQGDYVKGNFSAQVAASRFSSSTESGMNDILAAGYYQLPIDDHLSIKLGGGVLLPTYDSGYGNEATDYLGSISVSYLISPEVGLIGGYTHTVVNDDNVPGVLYYHDTDAFFLGANYMVDEKLAIGASYQSSDSIYHNVETIENLSAFGLYRFDRHWFGNIGYSYGLSDSASDHAFDLRIGYSF